MEYIELAHISVNGLYKDYPICKDFVVKKTSDFGEKVEALKRFAAIVRDMGVYKLPSGSPLGITVEEINMLGLYYDPDPKRTIENYIKVNFELIEMPEENTICINL